MEGLAPRPGHAGSPRRHGARRLRRCILQAPRQDLALLPPGREVHGQRRGAGRRAARLRGGLHLRRRPAAAVPGGLPRRAAAVPLGGLGHHREALVLRQPRPRRTARRLAPLDPRRAGLERHVRRLPLHRGAQALRPGEGRVPDHLVGDHGRLRGLPRPRLASRGLGRPAGDGAARRGERRAGHPHLEAGRRGTGRALRPLPRTAGPVRRPGDAGRRAARPLPAHPAHPGHLPPRRPDPRRGLRVARLHAEQDVRQRRAMQRLPRRPLRQAAQGGERPLHPLPPARHLRCAIAPLPQGHLAGKAQRRRGAASPATCRGRTSWWSTSGATTPCACRDPT